VNSHATAREATRFPLHKRASRNGSFGALDCANERAFLYLPYKA
jgi:hypothetical protein